MEIDSNGLKDEQTKSGIKIKNEIKNKKILHDLFIELVMFQKEIIASDLKLLIIQQGRDAAGKDGTIIRIKEHHSLRETKLVALGKPSDLLVRE